MPRVGAVGGVQGGAARRVALGLGLALAGLAAGGAWALAGALGSAGADLAAAGALAAALAGLALALRGLTPAAHPHDRLGAGNVVTLARGAGIAALAGVALAGVPGPDWALVALAAGLVALDGIDGRAARASGTQSDFGARLDVETDVALAAVLALLAWQTGQAGAWFLALPLARPAWLLAGWWAPWIAAPLPPRARRKWVAGAQYAGQVALLAPALAPGAAWALAAGIVALVAWSFAADLRWLARHRGAAR